MTEIEETSLNEKEEAPFAYHFLWYFLQLIIAAPGVMVVSIPVLIVLNALGLAANHLPGGFAGYEMLAAFFVGVLVGRWMASEAPQLTVTGCWIWVLPAAVVLVDLALGPDRRSGYLFESKAEGLGVLIAISTVRIAGYSIGMALWRSTQRRAKEEKSLLGRD